MHPPRAQRPSVPGHASTHSLGRSARVRHAPPPLLNLGVRDREQGDRDHRHGPESGGPGVGQHLQMRSSGPGAIQTIYSVEIDQALGQSSWHQMKRYWSLVLNGTEGTATTVPGTVLTLGRHVRTDLFRFQKSSLRRPRTSRFIIQNSFSHHGVTTHLSWLPLSSGRRETALAPPDTCACDAARRARGIARGGPGFGPAERGPSESVPPHPVPPSGQHACRLCPAAAGLLRTRQRIA